ncbi:MAG: hypothetical protein K8R60_20445 [Burkholderiales bacterium]|nr:hypothetical protein [Burkholderiales bacterium]
MILRNLLPLVLPVAVLGCATVAQPQPQSNVAGMTCWKELPTGSSLPVTRCMSEEERQRAKAGVDAMGDDIHRAVPNKTPGRTGS